MGIRPGDYVEHPGYEHPIVVDSIAIALVGLGVSPEDTRLSLQFWPEHCRSVLVENLTFRDAMSPLYAVSNDRIVVRRCRFIDNTDSYRSAAAYIYHTPDTTIEDCVFLRNRVTGEGGFGGALDFETGVVRRCLFMENEASGNGGAIHCEGSFTEAQLVDDVFVGNVAYNGAAITLGVNCFMYNCTLWGNRTTWSEGAAIELTGPCEVERCIVGRTANGYGIGCWGGVTVFCLCFWENERGKCVGPCGIGPQFGDFEGDPLLCDPDNGDFSLDAASPCLPGAHGGWPCGQIGAFGLGCGDSPTRSMSWGQIKNLYRQR